MSRLTINDIQYYVECRGAGDPLLLLHGFTSSSATWAPYVASWPARAIAVDLPGHGQTDAPTDPARYRMEVTVAEYRNGNESRNHVRKMNGIYKASDVTLKRGVIGVNDFFTWIKDVRDGVQTDRSTVTIDLRNEENTATVMTWTLTNAKPMKYTGATLNAKGGTDVAIEELVLSCEKLDVS